MEDRAEEFFGAYIAEASSSCGDFAIYFKTYRRFEPGDLSTQPQKVETSSTSYQIQRLETKPRKLDRGHNITVRAGSRTSAFVPYIVQTIFVEQSAVFWRHHHSFCDLTSIPQRSLTFVACRSPTGSVFYPLTYTLNRLNLAIFIIIFHHGRFRLCILSQQVRVSEGKRAIHRTTADDFHRIVLGCLIVLTFAAGLIKLYINKRT